MMGSICCCFRIKDPDPGENLDTSSHGNCICPKCFISNLFNKYAEFFSSGQMHALSSSNQEATSSAPNGAPENTESDTVLSSPRNSKCHPESSIKFSLENGGAGDLSDCASPEDEDEDVCPTCLEEYTPENPKIMTHCSHHYHLSCIYEWMERSETCPVCCRVLTFIETN